MRNLKKVLSLVLCLAMMLSIMVVGAGAAFTDQSKIVNDEAVDMCVALNIINGYTDGSYKPEGTITRAEACKMICIALNGGKEPILGTNATASFTDIKGHWAEKYIEYCVSEGIVAGVGDGKFNPNGNVTGSQFAKMLLIALGFLADNEKFLGSAWEVNVNVKATQKGLYEDLETMDPSVALTRDNAAQMLWNALQANEVEYSYTLATENGQLVSKVTVKDITTTLLEDKYNTVDTDKTTGILTGISYNTAKDKWTYTIQELGAKNTLGAAVSYTTTQDFTDLLGQNVTFVVKANADKDVYGAFAADSVVLASGLVGDIDVASYDGETVEIDDVEYDVDALVTAIEVSAANHTYSYTTLADKDALAAEAPYFTYSAIDWDDDEDIDLVMVIPVAIAKVTYVGSDYVKAAGLATGSTPIKYTIGEDDWAAYAGVAKDDYILIQDDATLQTLGSISEIEKETGKIASYTDDTAVIDGTSYDFSQVDSTQITGNLNKTVDFRTVEGYVIWVDATGSVDLSDYVVVTGVAGARGVSGYYEAELLFTDGTSEVVTVKSVDTVEKVAPTADKLYTYEVSSGKYELTTKQALSLTDFDGITSDANAWIPADSASDANAKITVADKDKETYNAKFASDAIVFVNDDGDYSVKTGAELAKVTDASAEVVVAGAEKNSNNALVITFAFVSTSGVSSSDVQYGFITSSISTSKDSDGTYQTATIWTGTESVTLTTADKVTFPAGAGKGVAVAYKLDADGAITSFVDLTASGSVAAVGALTIIDGKEVTINNVTYKIDSDDTTVIYVDKSENAGAEGGSIAVATEKDGGGYYSNVFFYNKAGTDNVLELLIVDVDNDWNGENK